MAVGVCRGDVNDLEHARHILARHDGTTNDEFTCRHDAADALPRHLHHRSDASDRHTIDPHGVIINSLPTIQTHLNTVEAKYVFFPTAYSFAQYTAENERTHHFLMQWTTLKIRNCCFTSKYRRHK